MRPLNTTSLFSLFEPLDKTGHLTLSRNCRFLHTELKVTINPAHQTTHDQHARQITLLANNLQRLRSVLEECRRLKQISGLSLLFDLCCGLLNSGRLDENATPATITYAWILPYLSTASPAVCTPLHLVFPPWSIRGSRSFKQPLCPLMYAYLIAHYTHVFHLQAPVSRVMTWRTFNSSARNGYRKLQGPFVTNRRRSTILSEEPLFGS